MASNMKPFRLAGNIYFVGSVRTSSHLIDTGDGFILIDVGYKEDADNVLSSIRELGFDPADIKIIIISHGHRDHSAGVPAVKSVCGAKVYMNTADNRYLDGFVPDVDIRDGDVICLGNTEIHCMATPGHTAGTMSFFFDITENGNVFRTGMFGGAGTNQLKKPLLDARDITYHMRREFFRSVERLKKEHVDVFVGNHTWNNNTPERYEKSLTSDENPFIDAEAWPTFLKKVETDLEKVIDAESRELFVNYAHRGASHYLPENTFLAFYTGIYMGANGIETDVWMTKDGVPVLFHDDTLERVTGESGSISDYTYDELMAFDVKKDSFYDKIPRLDDFLRLFSPRDITFAIELKGPGCEKNVADMLKKYGVAKKTVVTSFKLEYIKTIKEYDPSLRVGLLTKVIDDELIEKLILLDVDEICPKADLVTEDIVRKLHHDGFRVRAWGVANEELMKKVYKCRADGMTVNFPDKLTQLISDQS